MTNVTFCQFHLITALPFICPIKALILRCRCFFFSSSADKRHFHLSPTHSLTLMRLPNANTVRSKTALNVTHPSIQLFSGCQHLIVDDEGEGGCGLCTYTTHLNIIRIYLDDSHF